MSKLPDIYTPYFELYLNGKEFSDEYYSVVSNIRHYYNSEGSDRLEVKISDKNHSFIENDIFTKSATIDFIGGWTHEPTIIFNGVISFIDIVFEEDADTSLVLNCLDNSSKLNRNREKVSWKNTTMKNVVVLLLKKHGITVSFKGDMSAISEVEKVIVQNNETDIQFLKRKLLERGMVLKITGSKAECIKKDNVANPSKLFSFKTDDCMIKSFKPSIDKEDTKDTSVKENVNVETKAVEKTVTKYGSESDKAGKTISNSGGSGGYEYKGDGVWEQTK